MAALPLSQVTPSAAGLQIGSDVASVSLADYLAGVASAVQAGLPARSWIEATVAAAKLGSYGHSLSLVDPAGGPSPAQMRAFLCRADRDAIARRLGAALDPQYLVGATRRDGTLVPTRAAALAAGDNTLTFADGAVSARVGAAYTTTQLIGAAA